MSHPFIDVGCFIRPCEFQNAVKGIHANPLENDIPYPHITFA